MLGEPNWKYRGVATQIASYVGERREKCTRVHTNRNGENRSNQGSIDRSKALGSPPMSSTRAVPQKGRGEREHARERECREKENRRRERERSGPVGDKAIKSGVRARERGYARRNEGRKERG